MSVAEPEAGAGTRAAPSENCWPTVVFSGRFGGGIVCDGGKPWTDGGSAVGCAAVRGDAVERLKFASVAATELARGTGCGNVAGEAESTPDGVVAARETARVFGLSLFDNAGLGSSLGAGEGSTFAGFLVASDLCQLLGALQVMRRLPKFSKQ